MQWRRRWTGLPGVAVQRAVAQAVLRDAGADLADERSEEAPAFADLPV